MYLKINRSVKRPVMGVAHSSLWVRDKNLSSSTCFARNYLQLQLQSSKTALKLESKYPMTHSIGMPQVDNLLTGYTVLEVFTSTKK